MNSKAAGLTGKLIHWLRQPVLGRMLSWPWFCRFSVLAAFGHVAFSAAGYHVWTCHFIEVTGHPCPGCGLTRSIRALIRGDWQASLQYHAFAAVAIVAIVGLVLGAFLPERQRTALSALVSKVEKKTAISQLIFIALMIYWTVRLIKMDEFLLMTLRNYN